MVTGKQLLQLLLGFAVLALAFWAMESRWPCQSRQPRFRRGLITDVIYWFFTPVVTRTISHAAIVLAVVPLLLVMGRPLDGKSIQAGFGPLTAWPIWAQIAMTLLIGDFIGYWVHRGFHGHRLWKFHAVHHSSRDLDWLSSVRLHPVNDVVARLCQAIPFVMLGFSPLIIAVYVPFLTLHAIALHANVSWTFGPFRYVVASPIFHRWHHSKEEPAMGKNFAGLFPLWDLLFGTLYMPLNKRPSEFGVHEDPVPESFWGQLTYPIVGR
jgi:sterol desaturase/sphingolipid hydroxylase (fatty acid hydroxylase superfamily)